MAQRTLPSRRPVGHRSLLATVVGGQTRQGARKAIWGLIFVGPWLIGLLAFVAGPILASLYLSFTTYDILSPPQWVGLANYHRAFFEDPLMWPSLERTFYFAIAVVPLGLIGSLILAILLNQGLRGTNIFRTAFFLPSLTPGVALSVLWLWLLHPKLGPVNQVLRSLGLGEYPWLSDGTTVIPSIILITLATSIGGSSMLIYLAGLQGVPRELEEAAIVDGAGMWTKFRHVTLPMITPTLFFNLIQGVIGALQVFTVSFVATNGGPNYGSWFIALHIYNQAFSYLRLGYGATLAWLLLLLVLALTLLNLAFSRKWVFYRGGT
jgi:multiple sugar transport system permease protein